MQYTESSKNIDTAPALCCGIFELASGDLDAMAVVSGNAPTTSGTIIGGSGSYAGARGTLKSVRTKTGNNDTVSLLG